MWARRPAVTLLALCWALAAQAGDKAGPKVGDTAPDFRSWDAVAHERVRLSDQVGKVVVLTFWATWCAPCRNELPILENLQAKVGKDKLIVYAVPYAVSPQAYDALVKIFRSWHVTPLEDHNGSIAQKYRITGIPLRHIEAPYRSPTGTV
jgi:thiol-disulfide isomerase/thioredoxin